jgi:uridine kinase
VSEKSKKSVEPLIVLITGASGSGKTSVAQVLEQKFSKETTSLYYFDDIGVPSTTKMIEDHGSGEKWQQWATARWIERIYNMDKEVIFLEGSFYPEFAVNKIKDLLITKYLIICLYAERDVREKRLIEERKQLELVTQDMENYAQVLNLKTINLGGIMINSTNKSISEIVQEITAKVNSNL